MMWVVVVNDRDAVAAGFLALGVEGEVGDASNGLNDDTAAGQLVRKRELCVSPVHP